MKQPTNVDKKMDKMLSESVYKYGNQEIELGKVYTHKDFPAFKTEAQISNESVKVNQKRDKTIPSHAYYDINAEEFVTLVSRWGSPSGLRNPIWKVKRVKDGTTYTQNAEFLYDKNNKKLNAKKSSKVESNIPINELVQLSIKTIIDLIPKETVKGNTAEARQEYKNLLIDLAKSLNIFYKSHDINIQIKTK